MAESHLSWQKRLMRVHTPPHGSRVRAYVPVRGGVGSTLHTACSYNRLKTSEKTHASIDTRAVLESPIVPLFPEYLTCILSKTSSSLKSISQTPMESRQRHRTASKAKTRLELSQPLHHSVIQHMRLSSKDTKQRYYRRPQFRERRGPNEVQSVKPQKGRTLAQSHFSALMKKCDNLNRNCTQTNSLFKRMKGFVNTTLQHMAVQHEQPKTATMSVSEIQDAVRQFKKRKGCFVYGRNGHGTYTTNGIYSVVSISDALAKLDSSLAHRVLADIEKKHTTYPIL